MKLSYGAPWHKTSWDRFIQELLPQLLSERIPLVGYHTEAAGHHRCRVKVVLRGKDGEVVVEHDDVPEPNDEGVFEMDGRWLVVSPKATEDDLDRAEIRCVGEQLFHFVEQRLGDAPQEMQWEETLAAAWVPITDWVREFLQQLGEELVEINWLSRQVHLRRVSIPERKKVFTPGHFGRTCPFETPEGPNVGRILTIAQGAEIRDSRLEIVENTPAANLGLSASAIPFLEHSDGNRLLMGANMMRQWIPQAQPEPALVQTGAEPDVPEFWCGRNLLTAFISWDGYTFEDAIVLSESAASRFQDPHPIEVGDKISNRHGSKGVVSCILPDVEMPHLNGVPIDLIYSVCGLVSRMNFGVVREALMGRIAKTESKPAIVPPFQAPSEKELRKRMTTAGISGDGMETLTVNGKRLQRPSTAGWVYWGRTIHDVRGKIHASVGDGRPQTVGANEYGMLANIGALETASELFNTCAAERDGSETLAEKVGKGELRQAGPPAPSFTRLVQRLEIAGIQVALEQECLRLTFQSPPNPCLQFALPVPHPWFRQHRLKRVGQLEELPEYAELESANSRLQQMVDSSAPKALIESAQTHLEEMLGAYLNAVVKPKDLLPNASVLFSGRTVTTPGPELHYDQIGLPEEICWTLFGPLLARETVPSTAPTRPTPELEESLDQLLAGSWVTVYTGWVLSPISSFLAFRPVRCPGRALRLPPLACELMNADFDGDQMAVFLPITKAGQLEAEQRLSIRAVVERNPELISSLDPRMDAVVGLASLSMTPEGHAEIEKLPGMKIEKGAAFITRRPLVDALREMVERKGVEEALTTSERLMRRGFEEAKTLGLSMNPFVGTSLDLPSPPEEDDRDQWESYTDEALHWLARCDEIDDDEFGPLNLLCKSGARGNTMQLLQLIGPNIATTDIDGRTVPTRHGWRQGLEPHEAFARVVGARRGIAEVMGEMFELERTGERALPSGYGLLPRARRANCPGVVFARAADKRESDPLLDAYSRQFVGLPPNA